MENNSIVKGIQDKLPGLDAQVRSRLDLDRIEIKAGALQEAAAYLQQKEYRKVLIAADRITYEAAGKRLEQLVEAAGVAVISEEIKPNGQGDVIADEVSLIQLMLAVQKQGAQCVIAVGGGTIHDITRYAAYAAGIPFVSVPTAPSVDGFNSKGAPIIVRGEKITIPAIGPDALFADLDILVRAPQPLVAAGFGDMLGKFTSLFDWKFGAWTAGEPYMEQIAAITEAALHHCVKHAGLIARREEEGIRVLMGALVESGLAMLLFGKSHPASGAEHHLSHYWEMDYIRTGRRQLLHGAKVGVACMEISKLYHAIAEQGPDAWSVPDGMTEGGSSAVAANWSRISAEIVRIPGEGQLKEWLATAGGALSPAELHIEDELLKRSMAEAHRVRLERHTLLRAYNDRNRQS